MMDKKNLNNNNINVKNLKNILSYGFNPLRNSYLNDIKTLLSFPKLIKFFDTPLRFDEDYLWRYSAIPYGSFFDKKKRNYVSFFSMGFKKNIGVLMPFILNYSRKNNKLHIGDWHKFSIIYYNSLKTNFDSYNMINNNMGFYPIRNHHYYLLPIAKHINSKRFFRPMNLADIDIDP
jgi:hypothetical protein